MDCEEKLEYLVEKINERLEKDKKSSSVVGKITKGLGLKNVGTKKKPKFERRKGKIYKVMMSGEPADGFKKIWLDFHEFTPKKMHVHEGYLDKFIDEMPESLGFTRIYCRYG